MHAPHLARKTRPPLLAWFSFCLAPLFAQSPPVVTDLTAWGDLNHTLHVRWRTHSPARCRVEYGGTQEFGDSAAEDPSSLRGTTNNSDSGIGWAQNHRVSVPGVTAWPQYVRVTGDSRDGSAVRSSTVLAPSASSPVGRASRATIPLAIHAGDWRTGMLPITAGVPFPQGALAKPENVRILLDGREIPCQVKVVTRWHADHTIKWLRIDFLGPQGTTAATLEYGNAVGRQANDADVDWEQAIARPGTWSPQLVDRDGRTLTGRIQERVLEEAGSVKAVLRVRGHYIAADGAALCAFTLRYHCWRSFDGVRLDYTFENDNTARELTSIRSLELVRAEALQPDALVNVGAGREAAVLRENERVLQREDFEWLKEPSGGAGRRLEGLVSMRSQTILLVRDFWRQWPTSIERRDGRLVVGLCPRLPTGFYAGRKDEDKLYYHIRDGLHTFRQGLSKTWEIWIGVPELDHAMLGEKPVASAPPAWIEECDVLRRMAVAARGQFPGYDQALAKGIGAYAQTRDSRREYGMMNFGDWYGERTWNWGNLEYDLGHGFLTQFARTGTPGFFRRAEEILRHQRDIDTRHYAKDPRRIGQQWTHCMGHTAGYYPKAYKDMKVYASSGWSDNRGHIWAQGMFEHYLLGGDTRSWETALLIADWAAGPQTTNFRFGNAREPGWMTRLVMSAYLATEDPYYLNAARIMLDKTHQMSLASGGHGFYNHRLPRGHCNCPDEAKHSGGASFMLGVLMTGMNMVYDATGDQTVADDIVNIARFIVDTMWVPSSLAFRYTSCPQTTPSAGRAWIMLEGMAFAARHSRDQALADISRSALAAAWGSLPSSGKGAGSVLCSSAYALEQVAHLPGTGFAEYRRGIERELRSPARRLLPTNLPNPDFEADARGWPTRGWQAERVTDVQHSGQACLKIWGAQSGQNEYINTTYDSSGSPYEIAWLRPGRSYRLGAWLRVDKITAGTPAPSLRLAFRDDSGTRGSKQTTSYDLSKLGTWQFLQADIKIPEWNTRNYVALNSNNRDEIEVVMYIDDLSLTPVDVAPAAPCVYVRLDPASADLSGKAKVGVSPDGTEDERIVGPGSARWQVAVPSRGRYVVWAKLNAGAELPVVTVGGGEVLGPISTVESTWVQLGERTLTPGAIDVTIKQLPAGPKVGRLVLTTDRSSNLE